MSRIYINAIHCCITINTVCITTCDKEAVNGYAYTTAIGCNGKYNMVSVVCTNPNHSNISAKDGRIVGNILHTAAGWVSTFKR